MRLARILYGRRNPSYGDQRGVLSQLTVLPLYFFLSSAIAATDSLDTRNLLAVDPPMDSTRAIKFLTDNFDQLPEKQIAQSSGSNTYAQYTQPTNKYNHNILGDPIEAEQLVVLRDGILYTHTPGEQYVFEDIKPRLFDVDSDGQMEVVTIRTHVKKGAGIMIYKITDNRLSEFAWLEEIGIPYRWLNIAAIYDLDGDGIKELAWIQTPHIGGILKIAKIQEGNLKVISEVSSYSNHTIGERYLCLSVVTKSNSVTTLYVPSQDRQQIVGFEVSGGSIHKTENIKQSVNFSYSLESQYDFSNVVQGEDLCAAP